MKYLFVALLLFSCSKKSDSPQTPPPSLEPVVRIVSASESSGILNVNITFVNSKSATKVQLLIYDGDIATGNQYRYNIPLVDGAQVLSLNKYGSSPVTYKFEYSQQGVADYFTDPHTFTY